MSVVSYLLTATVLISIVCTFGEIVQCQIHRTQFGTLRITANIAVKRNKFGNVIFKNEIYQVVIDTGSPTLFLFNKHYTHWKYDDPYNIRDLKFDENCDLTSPNHSPITPNFTYNPPKYEPILSTDITVHGGSPCPTSHISFSGNWLTCIWNVYDETVTIGQSDFILPIGGVWKVVENSRNVRMSFDGTLGLELTPEDINKPTFLFSIYEQLKLSMFAIYLGRDEENCTLNLGQPKEGIQRSKMFTVPALPNREGSWIFEPIGFRMNVYFCDGDELEERGFMIAEGYPIPTVMIDSGNSNIELPPALADDVKFYNSFGIDDYNAIPRDCPYWERVNPVVDIVFGIL